MDSTAFPPEDLRVFVVLGAYGAGKTEFSVNLALALAGQGRKTALADLDVVNPYFRSRSRDALLREKGIRLIAPATGDSDLPFIPAALLALIQDRETCGVIDAGGAEAGSRPLAAFAPQLRRSGAAVWYVLNRFRPDNRDAARAVAGIRAVEAASGLSVTGLVGNTHLLHETTPKDVAEGVGFAREVSGLTGLPVVCHAAAKALAEDAGAPGGLFGMRLFMGRPWEDG